MDVKMEGSDKELRFSLPGYDDRELEGIAPLPEEEPSAGGMGSVDHERLETPHYGVWEPYMPVDFDDPASVWASYPYGLPDEGQDCPYFDVALVPQAQPEPDAGSSASSSSESKLVSSDTSSSGSSFEDVPDFQASMSTEFKKTRGGDRVAVEATKYGFVG